MPSSPNYKRDYKTEYKVSQSPDKEKKNRAKRNTARRRAEAAGTVSKGDDKDVDHKRPLSKGGSNSKSNCRVTTTAANRSFKRKSDGSMK